MMWFKRKPRRVYHWEPMANITTEELALCLNLVISGLRDFGDTDITYSRLPKHAQRHWRIELK